MNKNILRLMIILTAVVVAVGVGLCIFLNIRTSREMERLEMVIAEGNLINQQESAETQPPADHAAPPAEEAAAATAAVTAAVTAVPAPTMAPTAIPEKTGKVIVLDPGHGKSSDAMSTDEKRAEGYEYSEDRGSWGEWRHFKNGTFGEECHGSGCTERCPDNGSCWYAMGNGDRDTEPEINLNNALAAKRYLEQMGYTVRLTRTSNDQNPSMTKRVSYCFPDNDTTQVPDADLYVCVHSNAGGGSGSGYITLQGEYAQKFIPSNYVDISNTAGQIINESVVGNCSLSSAGAIDYNPYLILFNKAPVPIAYLEIGFFDDSSDLAILQSESDAIGKGIAEGIGNYFSANS